MIEAATETGWYVYGVTESPAPVESVELGGLAAVVREVPLEEFGEEALRERLNDREWLEREARAHEGVLQSVAAVAPVVPLRFGTIYRDRGEVERMLEERREELLATLERVRGHLELGVKAWVDRARLEIALAAGEEEPAAGSGAAYLLQRQREQRLAREVDGRLGELAAEAHERLTAAAVAGVANRPQPRELTGRSETMLLNGAYLVRDGDEALRAEVAKLAADHGPFGVEYELTGPWPPHNFVGEEA